MKLENIGFYTLSDVRARNVNSTTPLSRCELLVTSECNFKCPYCRPMESESLSWKDAVRIMSLWCADGLRNIRFSGGEPTMWRHLEKAVKFAKRGGVERIAISTNGSAELGTYLELHDIGVNDFSISLDSCCSLVGNKMAGDLPVWDIVITNIFELSKLTYVTVGIVLTEDNIGQADDIIKFAQSLGVSDIRIIPAAQDSKCLPELKSSGNGQPILAYRLKNIRKNRGIRGISVTDTYKCSLVLDDMAVLKGKHYPCIIYLREGGIPIGRINNTMRRDRFDWFKSHNSREDRICRENCLDVCVDYNNRVKILQENFKENAI